MLPQITLSIVSHRQNTLANELLDDMQRYCADQVAVIVTQNVPDPDVLAVPDLSPPVELVVNPQAKGFGANHNSAFQRCRTPYFCVANPDIRLHDNPFPALLGAFGDSRVAVAAPLVLDAQGNIADSARRFPTPRRLAAKALRIGLRRRATLDYTVPVQAFAPDWVAGMFMLFRSESFSKLNGFDERYFLYYEDVDLCARLALAEQKALVVPAARVTHHARRDSRRRLRYAVWHARSMAHYLFSPVYQRLGRERLLG